MDNIECINISEFEKLKIQAIAVAFDCKITDFCSIIDIQIRSPGNVELHKKDGKRYAVMFISRPLFVEENYKSCLSKIAKIKNLKSIAFPEELVLERQSIEPKTKGLLFPKLLKSFVIDNPDIKVYILKGCINPPIKSHIHLSFGNISSQINKWRESKSGWASFFEDLLKDKTLSIINKFLQKEAEERVIYPDPDKIFNAMILTKLVDIKVIIIGQDPYHSPGAAMGLAFSHDKDCKKIQPSLKNIYKEMKSCGYKVNDYSGDLTKWANQGVFLINTALTVQQGKPNSHSEIWRSFTKKLFTFINTKIKNSVVIMWGAHAQSYENLFDSTRHKIIKSAHPSPLSAHNGFYGSKPFIVCNEQLKLWGVDEIDWKLNI